MFKKLLSLTLSMVMVLGLSSVAFARGGISINERKIVLDADEDEVYDPGKETFSLEDGDEYDIEDDNDEMTYDDWKIDVDVDGHKDSFTGERSVTINTKNTGDVIVELKKSGRQWEIVVDTNDFPDEDEDRDYGQVARVRLSVECTKTRQKDGQTKHMSGNTSIWFGYGRLTGKDNYVLEIDDLKDADDYEEQDALIPGKLYEFPVYKEGGSQLDKGDEDDFSFRIKKEKKASMFKILEFGLDKNNNYVLRVMADPLYDFKDYQIGEISLFIKPKKDRKKEVKKTYGIMFGYEEDDIDDDHFNVDEDAPIAIFENWIKKCTARIENVAMIDFNIFDNKRINFSYDRDKDRNILNNYSNANLDFLKFHTKPKFEAPVRVKYSVDRKSYVYEIVDGNLANVDAVYKEGYMQFSTKQLGSYVVSDRDLNVKTQVTKPQQPVVTPAPTPKVPVAVTPVPQPKQPVVTPKPKTPVVVSKPTPKAPVVTPKPKEEVKQTQEKQDSVYGNLSKEQIEKVNDNIKKSAIMSFFMSIIK